jgi:hypothetical protein
LLQGVLLDGTINLTQVVDTSVHLGLGASLHEVGDRDCSEEADDGHHNHDFNQRETRFASVTNFHTLPFSVYGVNNATSGLINQYSFCSLIACCNRKSTRAAKMPKV